VASDPVGFSNFVVYHALAEYPRARRLVRLRAMRPRRARYRRDGLIARFGADAALPDLLIALASCERRKDFSRPCRA
jgi:hypothetical protein